MNHIDTTKDYVLENERSRLEPLTWAHIDNLWPVVEQSNDLFEFSSHNKIYSKSDLQAYVQEALDNREKGIQYAFAIFDKQQNAYAGSSRFGAISNKNQRMEIGWTWVGDAYQRTGLNRNNKLLMIDFCLITLGFARVELKADARNAQSRKAMEGIGATFEGTLRSHMARADGTRRDTVYYSILPEEWPDIKARVFTR